MEYLKTKRAVLLWVVMVLVQISGQNGCFEEERMGLLDLKAFLLKSSSVVNAVDRLLPTWVDDKGAEIDCCGWERVTCNRSTGHVMELSLCNIQQVDDFSSPIWLLNMSLFLPFKELRNLNLSHNGFGGWTENEGFEKLSGLTKLEVLDLGYYRLNTSSIFQSLGALTSLKILNLKNNLLRGPFPLEELASLENLEMLDLSNNDLDSTSTSQDIKTLSKLSKLRHLDLSNNHFNKDIVRFLGALPSLKYLSLEENGMEGPLSSQELSKMSNLEVLIMAKNHLDGTLPLQGLCELKKLEVLDLSLNFFNGILPECLKSLTSLRLLDLSMNHFTGNISSSMMASLTSLEYLDLSQNRFEGLFSFSLFANHSKLEVVQFRSDNDKFEIETEYSDWVPMFQLKLLVLSNCNLNKLSGNFPKFLLHQNKLRVLDLSHNNLEGRFPNWLLENNKELQVLHIQNNSFIGQFHLPTFRNINVERMDISGNHFNGEIMQNIVEMLPHIVHMNLSRNSFEGRIPPSICDIDVLQRLDLSFNNFSGEVPRKLFTGCTSLNFLVLSSNRFHGQIFSTNFTSTVLMTLQLDNNQFTGTLSDIFSNCRRSLVLLDISNNFFSGEMPRWIRNFTYFRSLVMRNNSFKGQLTCEVFPVVFFDASHNSLSGSLPSCSNLYPEHLHLQGNEFTGSIPQSFLNSTYLLTLNIGDNNLSGMIPSNIGALSNLRILLLRGNHFNGLIPNQLCHLNKIGLMDLSSNSFSGPIPRCFYNITFGNIGATDLVFKPGGFILSLPFSFYKYRGRVEKEITISGTNDDTYDFQVEIQFVTKSWSRSYKGGILDLMSGLDLSCNNLAGEIPHELGKLSGIHALNLSHNQLAGPIPRTFYNLTQIESLDLSYNKLSGGIPSELIGLNFLAVFTVAHNNLSGRVPDEKGQFGTFEASSYEGNPYLCGPPLEKNCTSNVVEPPSRPTASSDESQGKWYDIDPVVFRASFVATYIMFLLGFATLLYVNPYWRRRWFFLIEEYFYLNFTTSSVLFFNEEIFIGLLDHQLEGDKMLALKRKGWVSWI